MGARRRRSHLRCMITPLRVPDTATEPARRGSPGSSQRSPSGRRSPLLPLSLNGLTERAERADALVCHFLVSLSLALTFGLQAPGCQARGVRVHDPLAVRRHPPFMSLYSLSLVDGRQTSSSRSMSRPCPSPYTGALLLRACALSYHPHAAHQPLARQARYYASQNAQLHSSREIANVKYEEPELPVPEPMYWYVPAPRRLPNSSSRHVPASRTSTSRRTAGPTSGTRTWPTTSGCSRAPSRILWSRRSRRSSRTWPRTAPTARTSRACSSPRRRTCPPRRHRRSSSTTSAGTSAGCSACVRRAGLP
jgi:hypothetical protein